MKKLLLILGIASVSMLAVAQSNDAAATRDQATGQASGKRMHKPLPNAQQAYEQSVITARETGSGMATGREAGSGQATGQASVQSPRDAATGQASGKAAVSGGKTAVDDWDAQNKMSGAQSNPMYKGNDKGGSNPLYQGKDRVATGDVTGDQTARATKTRSNIQNNRVATGDVDGDGAADVVVKSKSNITNNKNANDKQSAPREAGSGMATGKREHN